MPGARHKDAAAIEMTAPKSIAPVKVEAPRRRIISSKSAAASPAPQEVLVVASKLKAYIKARSDMNTSGTVMDVLSAKLRELCNDAIDQARSEGRKTVLDRDFKF